MHPDFDVLALSWKLALRADGHTDNTARPARGGAEPRRLGGEYTVWG